ncbi:MAG: bifunctional protein-serine/threonine kinase/phosphatase [Pseudomonas sp.]|nr:bifunctional protein-serine/threonine kinase/phosphatase [Pseudomonas sp.]
MSNQPSVSTGQCSNRGRKEVNQDFHGLCVPDEPLLSTKGIAIALADGISSSQVSQIASKTAVTGFLEDYYCTSDAWSVKKSAQRVLMATNSWLYAQTRQSQYRYDRDKGYVCTLSALIFKSTTAFLFHVGDARVHLLRGDRMEQLTNDHRLWITRDQSHLSRALGIEPHIEIDYRSLQLEPGDIFILSTDGIYEHLSEAAMAGLIAMHSDDLDLAARQILETAYDRGSDDNLTVQIVRIDSLPPYQEATELLQHLTTLPFAPVLEPRMEIDGLTVIRQLHASNRSHVFLARDNRSGHHVALKTPSTDMRHDPVYLERFLMEEWIARRIDSAHVVKAAAQSQKRQYLYTLSEFIEGQTLAQWMIDNPRPQMETVRRIVEQIARGLRTFHRLEMLHQDLRPANVMIDSAGTVKIIDFGATRVAGIMEMTPLAADGDILGTLQYSAPEYFLGDSGSPLSDLFSLAVITYQMLTGRLPYGVQVPSARTRAAQSRLSYSSVLEDNREIPVWIDEVLKKALHTQPHKRYQELSEFVYDLRHPNPAFLQRTRQPLLERNPLLFWQGTSAILAAIVALLVILWPR